MDAALSLDGLDDDRTRLFADKGIDILRHIKPADTDSGQKRGKRGLVFFIGGDAEGTERTTMEGMFKTHNLVFVTPCIVPRSPVSLSPTVLSCHSPNFECTLVRLCPRVGEEHLAPSIDAVANSAGHPSKATLFLRQRNEQLGQLSCPLVVERIACMQKLPSLSCQDLVQTPDDRHPIRTNPLVSIPCVRPSFQKENRRSPPTNQQA